MRSEPRDALIELLDSAIAYTSADITIAADGYHQARELCLSVGLGWPDLLQSLYDRHGRALFEANKSLSWLEAHDPTTASAQIRAFSCDCAERILGVLPPDSPVHTQLTQSIHTARGVATGRLPRGALREAEQAARATYTDTRQAAADISVGLLDAEDYISAEALREELDAICDIAPISQETAVVFAAWVAVMLTSDSVHFVNHCATYAVAYGANRLLPPITGTRVSPASKQQRRSLRVAAGHAERQAQWRLLIDRLECACP